MDSNQQHNRPLEKQSEHSGYLYESTDRMHAIIANAHDIVAFLDKFGRVLDLNKDVVFGHKREDLIGKNFATFKFLKASNLPKMLSLFKEIICGKRQLSLMEVEIEDKWGQPVYIEASTQLVRKNGKIEGVVSFIRDISDRKQVQKSLMENGKLLQSVMEATSDAIWDYDLSKGETLYNPGWPELLGYDKSELDPDSDFYLSRIHPEDMPAREKALKQHLEGKSEQYRVEYRVRDKEGNWQWILSRGRVIEFDRNGNPTRMVGTHTKVTHRKKAEQALLESQKRLQALFDNSLDAIMITNDSGDYINVNPAACDLLGYRLDELLEMNVADVIVPGEKSRDFDQIWSDFKTDQNQQGEILLKRKDGKHITAEYRAVADFLPGLHLSMIRDITDRKETIRKLYESEARFRRLIENSENLVMYYDLEGNILYCHGHSAYGMKKSELIGRNVGDFFEPEVASKMQEDILKVARTGKPLKSEHRIKWEGREFWFNEDIYPLFDRNDKITGIGKICQNITDRKQAELELYRANKQIAFHFENSPLAIIEWDNRFRLRSWSNGAEKIFGWSEDEVLGKGWGDWNFIHEDDKEQIVKVTKEMLEGKHRRTVVTNRNYAKNGEIRHCIWNNSVFLDENGKLKSILSMAQDITDRTEAENALRQSEQRFKAIAENTPGVVFSYRIDRDQRRHMTYFGPGLADLLGRESAEKMKHDIEIFLELVHPDDLNKFLQHGDLDPTSNKRFNSEFRIRVGAEYKWVQAIMHPYDTDGDDLKVWHGLLIDIDDRKKLELSLRHLSKVFMDASDPIIIVNPAGVIIDVNDEVERAYGWQRHELLYKPMTLILPPEFRDEARAQLKRCFAGEELRNLQGLRWHKNGEKVYTLTTLSPLTDEDGKIVAIASIAKNITALKRAEQALRVSEETYRNIFQNAQVGLFRTRISDGKVLECNDQAARMFGFKNRAEAIAQYITRDNYIDSGERERLLQNLQRDGQVSGFDARFRRKDGSTIWTRSSSRINLEQGWIEGVIEDITEQKHAEQELKASREMYRTLTENTTDIIARLDRSHAILFVNQAAKAIIKTDPEAIVGKRIDDLPYPEPIKSKFLHSLEKVFITGKDESFQLEVPDENESRYYDFHLIPEFTKAGQVETLLVNVRDITETRRLQDFASRAQRLETAGRIAGQVAHDFNNLLGPLTAYPDLIKDELETDHPALSYLDDMKKAAEQMSDINQELLTLGRRGHYNQEPLNLNEIVNSIINQIYPLPETLVMEKSLADDLMNIKGGRAQIFRAVANLLSNARDAMQDIGRLAIETKNYYVDQLRHSYGQVPRGEYVRLSIADSGTGIDPQDMPRIFDPFFTTKVTDKRRGTGLGLSVVHAVIEDHGGYIDLESKPGVGTTVYLYFPITREPNRQVADNSISGGSESILIVDDDHIQREVTSKLLSKLGYTVASATSGEQACEMLRKRNFDLLVLDMVMPGGIDGAQTYEQALKISPGQKAIIVSGYAESTQVSESQRMGAGAFIRKPLTLKSIAQAVRKELDRKQQVK